MVEEINLVLDKIQPVLTDLAEELGVASKQLWGILIKQQYVDGFIYVMDTLLIGGIILGIVYLIRKNWKKMEYDAGMWTFILGFIGIILVVLFANSYTGAIEHFVNPEYQALKDIFKLINSP